MPSSLWIRLVAGLSGFFIAPPDWARLSALRARCCRATVPALLLLTVVFLSIPGAYGQQAFVLRTEKRYTLEDLRALALDEADQSVDTGSWPLLDPYLKENKLAIAQGENKVGTRILTVLADGSYYVRDENSSEGYQYNQQGRLVSKVILSGSPEDRGDYPIRGSYYAYPSGRLTMVEVRINFENAYTFTADGALLTRCTLETCYKADGSPWTTRKILRERKSASR